MNNYAELVNRLQTKITAADFLLVGNLVEVLTDNCKEAATAIEDLVADRDSWRQQNEERCAVYDNNNFQRQAMQDEINELRIALAAAEAKSVKFFGKLEDECELTNSLRTQLEDLSKNVARWVSGLEQPHNACDRIGVSPAAPQEIPGERYEMVKKLDSAASDNRRLERHIEELEADYKSLGHKMIAETALVAELAAELLALRTQEPLLWADEASRLMFGKQDDGSVFHVITTSTRTERHTIPLYAAAAAREKK
jgi:chromosome segregation ATPase